jgi:dolichyl-phosphate-mannose--protein O-mannosyl transferase
VLGLQLHSHEIPYGSGSGQQSVTGYPENDDTNSYFTVLGPLGKDCERGTPITCSSVVRLRVRAPASSVRAAPLGLTLWCFCVRCST